MFDSTQVHALKVGTIWPSFFAEALLKIILPVTLVDCSICMEVLALTICLTESPFSIINVTAHMKEFTLAMCHVIFPAPFIASSI
jgi:hypothetical protein